MKNELRNIIKSYALRRELKQVAAIDELASLLSCSRAVMYRWLDGKGEPSPWQRLVLSMLSLPANSNVRLLVYPNPEDDDLDGNPGGGEIVRRQTLGAAALAGVSVRSIPFNRAIYDAWRGERLDTRALRAEWAAAQDC